MSGCAGVNQSYFAQVRIEFQKTVAELLCLWIIIAIAGHKVNIAVPVGGRTVTGLPDPSFQSTCGYAEAVFQLKRILIEGEQPTLIWKRFGLGTERDIDYAVDDKQCVPLNVMPCDLTLIAVAGNIAMSAFRRIRPLVISIM